MIQNKKAAIKIDALRKSLVDETNEKKKKKLLG
jgi:hypothetical protein